MFFSDSSRVSINKEKGLVRLSIKSSDYAVDEFIIPFSDFDSFSDSVQSKTNFSSDVIKLKWLVRDAILQVKESRYKRRIFKFSESKINGIISSYLSEKILYLDYLSKNDGVVHEFTDEYIYEENEKDKEQDIQIRQNDQMAKDLEKKMDQLIGICISLSETCVGLDKGLQDLNKRMNSIESKTSSQVVIQGSQTSDDGLLISENEETFIPSDINVNFTGSMSAESTTTGESALGAVEALKKLRGGK